MIRKGKQLVYGKVYKTIREMIALRRFEPGFNLNVEKLSRELGVSRTPVWEAMRRLEQEGVVETIPNRGVFMAKISLNRIIEVMEVRGALDKLAGRLAFDRMKKATLDRLDACLRDQLQAVESGDIAGYFLSDNRFHHLIYVTSGSGYLTELFESITLKMLPVPYAIHVLMSTLSQTSIYMAHQRIAESFVSGSVDEVEEAFAYHTEIIVKHLREGLRSEMERKETVRNIKSKSPLRLINRKRAG